MLLHPRAQRGAGLLALLAASACASPVTPADTNTTDAVSDIVHADATTDTAVDSSVTDTLGPGDAIGPMDGIGPLDSGDVQDAVEPADADLDATSLIDAPPADVVPFVDAGCGARYAIHTQDPGLHVDTDASITWNSNPPSSGSHFPTWVRWGIHTEVVPRGNYVHNLEHGGVVVAYRCDPGDAGGCAALRSQLEDLVRSLPAEPSCALSFDGGINRRVVLTEDPLLADTVAAAAWGWTYHASCVDVSSLSAFIYARTGRAPEETCAEGF